MSTPPPAELVLCRRCGTIPPGRPGRWPTCDRCRLTIRIAQVLDDGTGRINPSLEPLAAALLAGPRLDTARMWLYKPYAAELLSALATGRILLTHDELNRWPHHVAAQHLRHRLIACGVLPTVDRHLADTEVWLHRRLAQLADHPHERLLRQFALWHQLPKLRATAANRPLRSTAKPYATQQFTQAQGFLTWLQDQGIAPAALTQANLDTWYATHRVHQRQRVRGFLTWAIEQGHLPRHLTPHRVVFQPGTTITQQRRLALLRRYVTDDTTPLPTRVAACLLLLYAQPLTRVHRLTTTDLTDNDGELLIRLGDPPTPVPEPFAELLHQLAAIATDSGTTWLFPGKLPGEPVSYTTIYRRLRTLGFPMRDARVSAIRQLVLQAPAPVVADALGFHEKSTARQVGNAGATWSRYVHR
ncbi:hypothetical protein [Micromonospora sp. LOL_021]|uniref:hypothetical protein n=1 Tax=Micromonospora sp. LOL_021 TaxID=3345417 RepID=UPI003A84ED59